MRTRDILYKARNILDKNYTTGSFVRDDGKCCAVGAIRRAVGYYKKEDGRYIATGVNHELANKARYYVEGFIDENLGVSNLVQANDTLGKETTIKLFDKAIAKLNGRKYNEDK
jgi:hypothetical protein